MALTFSGVTISDGWTITPAFVPDAPTIGTATATGTTTATLTFTAPIYGGSTTITSYTATSSPGNITTTLNQAGSGTFNISGLTPNTSYIFTVTATNGNGTSINSQTSNSITTPPVTRAVNYLIIGGGGGGHSQGGGGGAGGLIIGRKQTLSIKSHTPVNATHGTARANFGVPHQSAGIRVECPHYAVFLSGYYQI